MNCRSIFEIEGFIPKSTILIGISGGDFSGKTSICQKIMEPLDGCYKKKVVYITQDSFRREEPTEKSDSFNPEHPDTLDKTLMEKTLVAILNGETVNIPKFDYESNKVSKDQFITVQQAYVVVVEGTFIFSFPEIRKLFGVRIFVDVAPDVRLARRMLQERNNLHQTINYYLENVKPVIDEFCLTTQESSHIYIPWGIERKEAVSIIVSNIKQIVLNRALEITEREDVRNRSYGYGS